LIAHAGSGYETFVHWLGMPINAVFMVLLFVVLFWHAALGLQVVIEDYIHSGAKVWLVLVTRFACFALTATGIMATLRIAFEAWGAA
jgi:succinate dehydrogenase / fumarate reductase membrane anchor subunit